MGYDKDCFQGNAFCQRNGCEGNGCYHERLGLRKAEPLREDARHNAGESAKADGTTTGESVGAPVEEALAAAEGGHEGQYKPLDFGKSSTLNAAGIPGAWLASLSSAERKDVPVFRGVLAYFPDALALIARHSKQGNDKHNPGEPLHWARGKSMDQDDCIIRHSLAVAVDPEAQEGGQYEIVARAWRSLAALQLWSEDMMRKYGRID